MRALLQNIQRFFDLGSAGILGINARNLDYVMPCNARRFYKNVDDKFRTKQLAQDAGIPTPQLYELIETQNQLNDLSALLAPYDEFVIKPAKGSGGGGILVIKGRKGNDYIKASGDVINATDLRYYISNILGGLYTLGGHADKAIIERRIQNPPLMDSLSYKGVPDIRLVIYKGVPAMGMLRLPTSQSDGKANLHAGGVGVGLCLRSGTTTHAIMNNMPITHHPDSDAPLADITLPNWDQILTMAIKAADMTQLNYIGVDIVLDKQLGPQLLEVNARPGIAIQTANKTGLRTQLSMIDAQA